MKLFAWLAPLVTGIVGAVLAIVVFAPASNNPNEDMQHRINSLEEALKKQDANSRKTIDDLQQKLAMMEMHPTAASATQPTSLATPNAEIATGVKPTGSASRSSIPMPEAGAFNTNPTPEFRAWVQKVVADQKAEDEAKEKQAAEQRRVERVSRRVDRAAEELGLSTFQKDEVKKILVEEETARTKMFDSFREMDPGQDREMIAQSFTEIRNNRDDKLRALLSPEQMDKAQNSILVGGPGPGGFFGGNFQRGGNREGNNPNSQPNSGAGRRRGGNN